MSAGRLSARRIFSSTKGMANVHAELLLGDHLAVLQQHRQRDVLAEDLRVRTLEAVPDREMLLVHTRLVIQP